MFHFKFWRLNVRDAKEKSSVCYEVSDTSFSWCSNVHFYYDINSCKPSFIVLHPPFSLPSTSAPQKGGRKRWGRNSSWETLLQISVIVLTQHTMLAYWEYVLFVLNHVCTSACRAFLALRHFYPLTFFHSFTWCDRVSFFRMLIVLWCPVPELSQQGAPKVKVQLVWKGLKVGKQVPLFAGLPLLLVWECFSFQTSCTAFWHWTSYLQLPFLNSKFWNFNFQVPFLYRSAFDLWVTFFLFC